MGQGLVFQFSNIGIGKKARMNRNGINIYCATTAVI